MKRLIVINFFSLLIMTFLFVALGQWNHGRFQERAYAQGRELIRVHLSSRGEMVGHFIEPPDLSVDVIHAGVITAGDLRYVYDLGIKNPLWVQLTALNLVISPKVEILAFSGSQE
jgi:hypothetical protein